MSSQFETNDNIHQLPRGGFLLETPDGAIQFGAPPETIKDTMQLTQGVPLTYVLPEELFNWVKGISIAELEFPIYFNYFIRKKKTRIICQRDQAARLTIVLQQALFGPENPDFDRDYLPGSSTHGSDIKAEMDFFRIMTMDDVVEFGYFEDNVFVDGPLRIETVPGEFFSIWYNDTQLGLIPGILEYKPSYLLGERLTDPFNPPLFGMTCLGPSSGFDPDQNTSGFILWVNHHGIMIDPPVNSAEWLLDSNVNPKLIDTVILTHCHADHDAGTFQKILQEERIQVYTTRTIMTSFLKKYSALTGSSSEYLTSIFNFQLVRIGVPFYIHGACFTAQYALHSIPTMSFRCQFQDRSLVYSSDHNNDPDVQQQLLNSGAISQSRFDELKNFHWDADIIFHESGMKPLHTPINVLEKLPDDVKSRTVVYHIPKQQIAPDSLLRLAQFGIENTLMFDVKSPAFERAYQVLNMIRHLDFLESVSVFKIQEMVSLIREQNYERGERIIERGTPGEHFYIVAYGSVAIRSENGKHEKVYGLYDYFGEMSLITGEPRSADVVALTKCTLYTIEKNAFLHLIENTEFASILYRLAKNRQPEVWETLSRSRFLTVFTQTQRTYFESMIKVLTFDTEEVLVEQGRHQKYLYMVHSGAVIVADKGNDIAILQRGDIAGSAAFIYQNMPADYSLRCSAGAVLFGIKRGKLVRFLRYNPGLIMKLEYLFNLYLFDRT